MMPLIIVPFLMVARLGQSMGGKVVVVFQRQF